MKPLELQSPYKLKEILELAYKFNEEELKSFDNIWLFNSNNEDLKPETIVYIDEPVSIPYEKEDIQHEDFFSEFVKENNLWNCFYGEQFVDVLSNYKENRSILNIDLLIKGMNYYNEFDTINEDVFN